MKKTAIAIAVGALSIGLSQGLLAQDEDAQLDEQQQMTQEGAQEYNLDQDSQGQGAQYPASGSTASADESGFGDDTEPKTTPSQRTDPINDPTATDDQASQGGASADESGYGDDTEPMTSPSQQSDPVNDPTETDDQASQGGASADESGFGEKTEPMTSPSQQSDPVNDPTIDEDNDES
ncbi:hypothetical protein ACR80S_12945 [Halomonas sp. MA07-2]|uniref:hypothetical protein n=1 Tax=Halomonas sp. MA07-2 TaxID=3440841 RepID=UPI003EE8BCFF